MLRRQKSGEFHNYPEHRHGVGGVWRRLLWRLGFDPLTVYERLEQVRTEREDYRRWLGEAVSDAAKLREALRPFALACWRDVHPGQPAKDGGYFRPIEVEFAQSVFHHEDDAEFAARLSSEMR